MKSIENIGKTIGLLIAGIYLIFFQGNSVFEWVFIGIVLITVGIPHGSIDHLLLNPTISKNSLMRFIGKYLVIILVYLVIWVLMPVPALILFLSMSAYHFGQSHFIQSPLTYYKKSTYFLTGAFYLSVIFWGDFDDTALILKGIVPIGKMATYGWSIILGSFLISNLSVIRNQPERWPRFLIEMVLLGTLLYHLPLLMGFVLYFGFWHALPSMSAEYTSLKQHFSKQPLKRFVTEMIPFTAVSIAGIGVLLAILYPRSETEELILLFFVLISLISAPHIWFMNRFLEARKS